MLKQSVKRFLIFAFIVSAASCDTEIGKTFSTLFEIRNAAIEISEAENADVNIQNGALLNISLFNSYLNGAESKKRETVANKIAEQALGYFEDQNAPDSIRVAFVRYKRKYMIVEYEEVIEAFEYTDSGADGLAPDESEQPVKNVRVGIGSG